MILKEIVLCGFKSFADRTRIDLGLGVTTVVGPNGCGKSNVVDAIRWVLGEQSAKALRGGKMQDVIFAGTDSRPAAAECEVSLLFTDCEEQLGTAFHEVQITRRVTGEGGSYYYLNGKASRLKDIQNLFMDTGLGRTSYSFMMQGQIDQILSSNPEERRIIFEEAAGVTRYKNQRREALAKLDQVDRNLARVKDVIDEVSRQKNSLKRQASKALRYQRLKYRFDHLDLAHSAYQYSELKTVINYLQLKFDSLKQEVDAENSTISNLEESLNEEKLERSANDKKLQASQQRVYELKSQREQFINKGQVATVRKNDSQTRIVEISQEIDSIARSIKNLQSQAQGDSEIKQLQLNLVDSSDVKFQENNQKLQALETKLKLEEDALQKIKLDVYRFEAEFNRLLVKSTELEVNIKTNDSKILDFDERLSDYEKQNEDVKQKITLIQTEIVKIEDLHKQKNETIREAEAQSKEILKNLQHVQARIQEKEKSLATLNTQLHLLEGLQAKLEGFSEGSKAIIKGKLSNVLSKDDFQVLAEGIEVKEGFEAHFETLLSQSIDAISLKIPSQIPAILESLASNNLGRACFQVQSNVFDIENSLSLPNFLHAAIECVDIKNASLKKHWKNLLQHCYFADSLEEFLNFWEVNSKFSFLLVSTSSGELIDGRGLIYGGSSNKKSRASSFLQREKDIRALKVSIEEENKILSEIGKEAGVIKQSLTNQEQFILGLKADAEVFRVKITELRTEERSFVAQIERNNQAISKTQTQKKELSASYASSQKNLEDSREKLKELTAQIESAKEIFSVKENEIVGSRGLRDAAREEISELRIELAEKKQKLLMIDQSLSELQRRSEGLIRKSEQLSKEELSLKDKILAFQQEYESVSFQAEEIMKSINVESLNLESCRAQKGEIESKISDLEKLVKEKRKILQEQENLLKNTELSLTKESSKFTFLNQKIQEDHQIDIEIVDWKSEIWAANQEFESKLNIEDLEDVEDLEVKTLKPFTPATEEDLARLDSINWQEIEEEIKILKDKLTSMGSVNLVAIEEYAELKQRFDFLLAQSTDLQHSKTQLIEAIEDINKISQQMFVDTFNKVRINFRQTFEKLFGGGFADIELLQSEDILEAGVEIIARPPGTKLKSLTLLSGGQKTMTAVALLFAIYQVKPSPFCVLDELDAPLDDANIGRFTAMLREFTQYSQFLVISHNKRTISESNTIYGVTMEERGVTKLLSMRFNNREESSINLASKIDELVEV